MRFLGWISWGNYVYWVGVAVAMAGLLVAKLLLFGSNAPTASEQIRFSMPKQKERAPHVDKKIQYSKVLAEKGISKQRHPNGLRKFIDLVERNDEGIHDIFR
jgi:hypothetical protein